MRLFLALGPADNDARRSLTPGILDNTCFLVFDGVLEIDRVHNTAVGEELHPMRMVMRGTRLRFMDEIGTPLW